MRICLWCIKQKGYSVFSNIDKCFICLPYKPPSYVLSKIEEREYQRLSRAMGWGHTQGGVIGHSEDLEALERFRDRIMKGE